MAMTVQLGTILGSLLVVNLLQLFFLTRHTSSSNEVHNLQAGTSMKADFVGDFTTTSTNNNVRRAVGMFIDRPLYMYGLYSVQQQMKKFHMIEQGVELVAVIPDKFPRDYPKELSVLKEWLGESHVKIVEKKILHDKLDATLWKGTFNKLFLFDLTEYKQLIVLDSDVLVRKSLIHWFDYPTPCGIQSPDDPMIWNSGAMVIQPNAAQFQQMLNTVPQMRAEEPTPDTDSWTAKNSNTDQDFLSAFFTHPNTNARFSTLPSYASVISSRLTKGKYQYWIWHRPDLIETVHFTSVKPWKKFATSEKVLCDFLLEWKESLKGIERYEPRLAPLPYDYLRNCQNDTSTGVARR